MTETPLVDNTKIGNYYFVDLAKQIDGFFDKKDFNIYDVVVLAMNLVEKLRKPDESKLTGPEKFDEALMVVDEVKNIIIRRFGKDKPYLAHVLNFDRDDIARFINVIINVSNNPDLVNPGKFIEVVKKSKWWCC